MKRATVCLLIANAAVAAALPVRAATAAGELTPAQRAVLAAYLGALGSGRFGDAFKLLTASERRYFVTPANFASVFAADKLVIGKFRILKVEQAGKLGTVAVVSENVSFLDHGHQATATATARVAYGLVAEGGSIRVKDPYKPWKAFIPKDAAAHVDGLQAVVRKISFFTGRVEFLITFQNSGDGVVTLLPYGKSVLRDDAGKAYQILDTRLPEFTDKQLRLGLLLAAGAEYTGALTFVTPDRFTPRSLSLTLAPNLRDGADAPFEIPLPVMTIPG